MTDIPEAYELHIALVCEALDVDGDAWHKVEEDIRSHAYDLASPLLQKTITRADALTSIKVAAAVLADKHSVDIWGDSTNPDIRASLDAKHQKGNRPTATDLMGGIDV